MLKNGFVPRYSCWSNHRESLVDRSTSSASGNDNIENTNLDVNDNLNDDNLNNMLNDLENDIGDSEQDKLQQLFEDSEKPLYNGCENFTKLSAVMKLFNIKSKYGWSDISFTSLLVVLNEMLPKGNELPISLYQENKLMCPMGLKVKRIHACPNDCMLY